MKTVRQAVIDLKARWSVDSGNSDGYFIAGDQLYYRCEVPSPSFGNGLVSINCPICNRWQFEAEAKRMGYINGYLWGKEYPANGVKPDLPDDVDLWWKNTAGDEAICKCGELKFRPEPDNACPHPVSVFKIVDPRYKPADEAPDHIVEVNEKVDNSWRERGEFPPSGAYCQFLLTDGSGKWVNCFIIGIDDLGFCVCRADMDYFASMSPASFRPVEPVKTDCQKFIESAIDAAIVDNGVPVSVVPYMNEIFERMFHAGFKSPEQRK